MRELARITQSAPGALHKELVNLLEGGILRSIKVGNQVRYSADTQCPIYEELAGIMRKTTGLVDVLADALTPIKHKVNLAFVFGSVARGEQTSTSDVDIMLIGSVSFGDAVQALYGSQATLQRELNPVVYSVEAFKHRIETNDSFIKAVLDQPKLFIIGADNELRQLT